MATNCFYQVIVRTYLDQAYYWHTMGS